MSNVHQNQDIDSQPTLCVKGCGFFANGGCGGLCSKCHRESMSLEDKRSTSDTQVTTTTIPPATSTPAPALPESSSQCAATSSPESQSTKDAVTEAVSVDLASDKQLPACSPSRCYQCRKKVGLTGFKCKCGQVFCGGHRYAESHDCPFDHKSQQREQLAKSNPQVQASKIQKF